MEENLPGWQSLIWLESVEGKWAETMIKMGYEVILNLSPTRLPYLKVKVKQIIILNKAFY